ncbi:MAG: M48 family metalloprotease [Kiritimatiellia bacterium]|nr:M48 family metalloprotease [Kiritimatiellia bacterium]
MKKHFEPGATHPDRGVETDGWTRRAFLGAAGLTGGALLTGCASNPVTGKRQWMLISEAEEIRMDREVAAHQFSADYGALQSPALQTYVSGVGRSLAAVSHRPGMPYSFRALHASYVNAYTFPGGSIGITRGILLGLESEAALAALIGHEIGHVAARHGAERMSKGLLSQMLVLGLGVAVSLKDERYAPLAVGLGGLGAGLLLARYSRADERQADDLGLQYMVKAGYNPSGMVELMDMLVRLNKSKPNALETMFASHPMSAERYETARHQIQSGFPREAASLPANRERYLDATADLRARRPLIEALQAGDSALMKKSWDAAQVQYETALRVREDDYEALLKMAKCRLARKQPAEARPYAVRACAVYPEEPQGLHVRGMIALESKAYDQAAADFDTYLERLPGNPLSLFFSGRAHDGLNSRPKAVERYSAFLQQVQSGSEAEYAYRRLVEWKVIQPPPRAARPHPGPSIA